VHLASDLGTCQWRALAIYKGIAFGCYKLSYIVLFRCYPSTAMGNSPSSSPTSKWCSDKSFSMSISKPSDLSRRASAQPTTRSETRTPASNNMLAVPSTPRHRRSRSANAAIRVAEAAPPPPPYSYAPPLASIPPPVSQSMRSSPTAESPLSLTDAQMARMMSIGSRHTNVFTAPGAAPNRPARTSSCASVNYLI